MLWYDPFNPFRNPTDDNLWIKSLVDEARRVGKVPWSADSAIQLAVYTVMNQSQEPPPYPQESMEESVARWTREGCYTGVPGEGPRWHS